MIRISSNRRYILCDSINFGSTIIFVEKLNFRTVISWPLISMNANDHLFKEPRKSSEYYFTHDPIPQ